MGVSAIFTRRRDRDGFRMMHAVRPGERKTVCELPIGIGTGLVRDGDYRHNHPCPRCWNHKGW